MDHQPNDDNQITFTPDPKVLAIFILSLLQQPRRIGRHFGNNISVIDYQWSRNLIEICEHRMEQHKYSICSFSGDIYYENGKVDNISSKEAFYAYLDSKQCRFVGVDLSISFLVSFGTKTEPEKQDLRVQVFSDESYKFLVNPSNKIEPDAVVSYSISFSNLTWGEDISRHINSHIETALKDGIFTKSLIYISRQAPKLSNLVIFQAAFMASIFVMNKNMANNKEKFDEVTKHNVDTFNLLLDENTIESVSRKLNVIMQQISYREFSLGFGSLGLVLIIGMLIALVPHIAQLLTRRFCVSFVIFNDYTKILSTKYIANNEKLKWLVISTVVGMPVALFLAYVKGLFSL